MASESTTPQTEDKGSFLGNLCYEIFTSPLNLFLVCLIAIIVYKLFKTREQVPVTYKKEPELPKMKKRDFTLQELKSYDGTGSDGRILVAVNGKVFDVTKGKTFYGPDGPYAAFAGHDASRGLATFSVTGGSGEYDDLSDLTSVEMDSVKEWEMQFTERYDYVGKLLKPGQEPTNYSSEEEDETASPDSVPTDSTKPKSE